MRYVKANTTIPVPEIYHYGTAAENPTHLGPFIIMEYIDHDRTLSDALNDPQRKAGESHVLDANISEQKLEFLYQQMADIVLQLSTLSFSQIGSMLQNQDGTFSVSGRPLIQNMNSLIEFAGVNPSLLPSKQYGSSLEWYAAMADMHLAQIAFQHNDAVLDEDDVRDKYVARQLFRRLASTGKLALGFNSEQQHQQQQHYHESVFRLFSEDLRPSNVLVDQDSRVVGVIDWEFAYAAPVQFSIDPPWWLLLTSPEYWPGGYDSWMAAYEPRLDTFLRVLERAEKERETEQGLLCPKNDTRLPLSQEMRKSWSSKNWMISYAARNSWTFDFIFWRYLDGAFFGENDGGDHRKRLDLLAKEEIEAMEALVKIKMEEKANRKLTQWDYDSAVARLAKIMV